MQEFLKKLIVILKKDGRKMEKYIKHIGIIGIIENLVNVNADCNFTANAVHVSGKAISHNVAISYM